MVPVVSLTLVNPVISSRSLGEIKRVAVMQDQLVKCLQWSKQNMILTRLKSPEEQSVMHSCHPTTARHLTASVNYTAPKIESCYPFASPLTSGGMQKEMF